MSGRTQQPRASRPSTSMGKLGGTSLLRIILFSLILAIMLAVPAQRAEAVTNQPPVPDPQTIDTPEEEVTPITLTATDAESDPISYFIYSPPANGTLTGTPPFVTYTPVTNFNGMDSFEFKVKDAFSTYQYATITLIVSPVNDAPVTQPVSVSTSRNEAASILLLGDDVDDDALTYVIVSGPSNGTVTGTPPDVLYTPATNFTGSDTFSYKAKDGALFSSPSSVTVAVLRSNTPPTAVRDEAFTDVNTAVQVNVLSNDSDIDGDTLSLVSNTSPANGTVSCTLAGLCTYSPATSFLGTDTFTYKISDGQGGEATTTVTIEVLRCPASVQLQRPSNGASDLATSGILKWSGTNADSYTVYFGREGTGCQTRLGTTPINSQPYDNLEEGTTYEWKVAADKKGCTTVESICSSFSTGRSCETSPPRLLSPADGASALTSPVTFSWTSVPEASSYQLYYSANGGTVQTIGEPTSATSLVAEVPGGSIEWYVEAIIPNCSRVASERRRFGARPTCSPGGASLPAPIPAVIGEVTTGESYSAEWSSVEGSSTYEIQESTSETFAAFSSRIVRGNSAEYNHFASESTAYFYRVRAIADCNDSRGSFSEIIRIVVIPIPRASGNDFDIVVPESSKDVIIQPIRINLPTAAAKTASEAGFTATTDKPWMIVTPSSGTIPPNGLTVVVTADPTKIPVGSNTGTVIVQSGTGAPIASVPVTVSIVTPVAPVPKNGPPDNALIIPSVSHVEGLNSSWQSDVRMTNTSGQAIRYQLSWTRSGTDGTQEGKQTGFQLGAGQTIALNDIVKQWYGLGSLSDGANGVLEIRPINFASKGGAAPSPDFGTVFATVASSRTYNVTSKGTLGQFIPAIPFGRFVGQMNKLNRPAVLSLQHITQSAKFRTNFGIVEGSGQPATVLVSLFNSSGAKIDEFSIALKAGEQRQFDALLASRNLSVEEARIEVKVTSTTGRVTAYASVVDNGTGDPLLVPAVDLGELSADRFVIPGVADIDNGVNRWRSDLRLFNGSDAPLTATAEFFPQDHPESSVSAEITINPGEVKVIDDAVRSLFGRTNVTGAIHLKTATMTSLVATARTFDQQPEGSLGQFVPAFTSTDGFAVGDRALQILQIEESDRFRTNVGIAELTGNPVTIRLRAIVPDSTIAPSLTLEMKANEFKQLPALKMLGLKGVYNGRITVEVLSGAGKIAAYASVVDNTSQDPTYVPGQ